MYVFFRFHDLCPICHLFQESYEHDRKPLYDLLPAAPIQQEVKQQDFFIGTVRVNGRMDWPMLDSAVSQAFKVRQISQAVELHVECVLSCMIVHALHC